MPTAHRFPLHQPLSSYFCPKRSWRGVVSLVLLPPILAQTAEAVTWSQWAGLSIATSGSCLRNRRRFAADSLQSRHARQRSSQLWLMAIQPTSKLLWRMAFLAWHLPYLYASQRLVAVLAMALLTFLLTRFTGVKRMESDIEQRRPGYTDYVTRTSSFFPWRQLLIAGVVTFSVAPDVSANDSQRLPPDHPAMPRRAGAGKL